MSNEHFLNDALLAGFISVAASAIVNLLLIKFQGWLPVDRPNHRSLHKMPIPRTGGIAILVGILVSAISVGSGGLYVLMLLAVMLGAISFLDDLRGLPVRVRFSVQMVAAALLIWQHLNSNDGMLVFVLCVLTIVWMTNVYNFMDGSDGLAAGMTLFGFGTYAIGAHVGGAENVAVISAAIAGAAAAFLVFNFQPARIFMGDVGSIALGFLAGGLGLIGWMDGLWPLGFPAVIFSPFLVDATITLAKRVFLGLPASQAHRDHYFQRLILLGFSHRSTALVEYALMAICCAGGMVVLASPELQPAMIVVWIVGYAILLGCVEVAWRKRSAAV